jgi:hypothetical protein
MNLLYRAPVETATVGDDGMLQLLGLRGNNHWVIGSRQRDKEAQVIIDERRIYVSCGFEDCATWSVDPWRIS